MITRFMIIHEYMMIVSGIPKHIIVLIKIVMLFLDFTTIASEVPKRILWMDKNRSKNDI